MGIGFVFLIYLVLLALVVLPSIFICAGLGYWFARRKSWRIKRAFIIAGGLLPLAGGVYLVVCIIIMAMVGLATGRDVGFGDGFDLPLDNHYHWSAIDDTDFAMIYDVRDKSASDGDSIHIESDDRDAFDNVVELQEEGDWLAGAYVSEDESKRLPGKKVPDCWFLFNTRTHQRLDAKSEDDLRADAAQQGIQLHMQSSDNFYSSHRFGWKDVVVVLMLLLPPPVGLFLLWKAARRALQTDL